MAKFTKGPWRIDRGTFNCADKPKDKLCSIRTDEEWHVAEIWEDVDECEANAALIAAAPELYAFIEKQIGEMNCICRLNKTMEKIGVNVECTVCKGNALLSKARGEVTKVEG